MPMRSNLPVVLSFLIVSLLTGLGSTSEIGAVFPHPAFGSSFMNDALRTLQGPASATELLNELTENVMGFIEQRDNEDTSTATALLANLTSASALTETRHTDVAAPDSAWDTCLIAENASLHAWKVCNSTLQTMKGHKDTECADMVREGVGSYTIDAHRGNEFSYSLDNSDDVKQTCNFETFTIDSTGPSGIPCGDFVEDIIASAREDFGQDMALYTSEKNECLSAQSGVQNKTLVCSNQGEDYFDKEEECVSKSTTLNNKICLFQTTLENKCRKLGLVNTELTALESLEAARNREFRTVMRLKCLFTRYTEDEKCFDTTADTACDTAIDGASVDYGSRAAQELHGFRTERDTDDSAGGFQCTVNSVTFGDNVRYAKSDPSDDYSYYELLNTAQTYTSSEAGVLDPPVCTPQ